MSVFAFRYSVNLMSKTHLNTNVLIITTENYNTKVSSCDKYS